MPFKKGVATNPSGRPKGATGFQKPADRLLYWLRKPIQELQDMAKNGKLAQQSALDASCIARILHTMSKENGRDFELVMDRAFGKLADKLKVESETTVTIDDRRAQAQQEASQMLAKLSERSEDKSVH